MIKILFKSAVLVFIVLSIYFIVNPSACSNFMMGRVVNPTDGQTAEEVLGDHGEMFVPAGDRPLRTMPAQEKQEPAEELSVEPAAPSVVGITDTNTMKETALAPAFAQEDIDYAVASRYVELENEYAKQKKTGPDVAKEISARVMDDFELSQQEWESFLERATASNLFNKIRTEQQAEKK